MALFLLCPNLGWIQGQFNFTELSLRYLQLSSANVHQGYAVVPYWHYIGVKGTIPKSASAEPPVPHRDARSGRCEIRFLGLRWVPHCDNTPVPLNCLYHMYED